MESIELKLKNAVRFGAVLGDSLKEHGDLELITKEKATVGGHPAVMHPAVMITFTVELPDGTTQRVQAVTTLVALAAAVDAMRAAHRY